MIELELPYPPSVNAMWRTPSRGALAGRTMLSQEGRRYRKAVADAVLVQRANSKGIGIERCSVDIEARMPDKRRRDIDNLPKAVLDALTHVGIWHDDSQVDDLRIWRSEHMGGVLLVRISTINANQACSSALLERGKDDMTDEQRDICRRAEVPQIQSMLYDLNLLPEQTLNDPVRWFYTATAVKHMELAAHLENEHCAALADGHFIPGHPIAGPAFAAALGKKIRERHNVRANRPRSGPG